jgi:predicted DNA-binding transcriptional regulator AlpA
VKSSELCRAVGISYSRLWNLVRSGRLARPRKDGSGDLLWGAAAVEQVRAALARRRRRGQAAEAATTA